MLRLRLLPLLLALPTSIAAGPALRADAGDDRYRLVVGLVERELYDMAVAEAEGFLTEHADHPKAPLARYRLATALFELGRHADAAPHYGELARRRGFEYRAETLFRLGQCELSLERLAPAKRALESVLEESQDYLHVPATFLLGEVAFRARLWAEAAPRYEEVLRRAPDSPHAPDARRALAWCAWEADDVEGTVRNARDYLRRHADHGGADDVRVLLGEALLEGGAPREALEAYGTVAGGPLADAALRGTGFAHAALGEHVRAAEAFGRLVAHHPESEHAAEARLHAGIQLLQAGRAEEAAGPLREAARSEDPQALYWLARAERERGRHDAALAALERALGRSPDAELAERLHVARGDLLRESGRVDSAMEAYEQGGSDYALYAAAVAAWNDGDGENAARLSRTLLEQHPESSYRARARGVLGEALFAAGRHADARRTFERALSEGDDADERARALSRLGWCHYLEGDPAAAVERFAELRERHPDAAEAEEALFLLARARAESGDARGAARDRRRYLAAYPAGAHRVEVLFDEAEADDGEAGLAALEAVVAEPSAGPLAARALLALGERQARAGEHAAAAETYRRLLSEHARSEHAPAARYGLAWALFETGENAEAARVLSRLSGDDLAPELAASALELEVWTRCGAGDTAGAAESWRRFARVADDERAFRAARVVVDACRATGRTGEAQGLLDELLGNVSDRAVAVDVLVEGAYLALDEGDVDRAEAQVQVAGRQAADRASVREASFFVGEARFERGEDERAIALYKHAAGGAEDLAADALYKLGFAELRAGRPADARLSFERLVREHPESALRGEGLFLLGEACHRAGDAEGTVRALERLREEAPGHEVLPKALFRLGLAYGALERWKEAEARLSELARRHPDFPNAAEAELGRGKALVGLGRARTARQAFDRVLALDRGELAAEATLSLGRLHEAEGNDREALSLYLKVAVLYGHEEKVAAGLLAAGGCLERLGDPDKAARQYAEVVERHADSAAAPEARRRLSRLEGQR